MMEYSTVQMMWLYTFKNAGNEIYPTAIETLKMMDYLDNKPTGVILLPIQRE